MKTQLPPEFLNRYQLDPELQHAPGAPVEAGQWFAKVVKFGWLDMVLFSITSGDWNPLHYDGDWARRSRLGGRAVSGGLLTGTFSGMLAMHLPGPGTIYSFQMTQYSRPARMKRPYVSLLKVMSVNKEAHFLELDCVVDEMRPIPGERAICTGAAGVVCDDVELVQAELVAIDRFFEDHRLRRLKREKDRLASEVARLTAELAALRADRSSAV
jgi:MaoC like domain